VSTEPTDAELLTAVKLAIKGVLEGPGANYTIRGRTVGSLSLTELMAVRNDLEQRIARADGNARPMLPRFRTPG